MYPRFSDLLNDLLGTNILLPIQTYGFFVAVAFIVGGLILKYEFSRKVKNGKLKILVKKVKTGVPPSIFKSIISVIAGGIIGYKFLYAFTEYNTFAANPQDFVFSAQGSWLGACVFAIFFAFMEYLEYKKSKKTEESYEEKQIHPKDIVWNILIVAAIAGMFGAKLFHILENFDTFLQNPIIAIFSFSGLTFFGGLICGTTAVLIYLKKQYNIKSLHTLDAGAPAIALGYGIGRIGCQLSGDGCWGIVNTAPKPSWMSFLPDWMWAFNFPHNVINSGMSMPNCTGIHCQMLPENVFPTSFYETLMMLAIFTLLWIIRNKIHISGIMFSCFLILAGIERFVIEQIRVNNVGNFMGLEVTQAEVIATLLFIMGITGIILINMNKNKLKNY